MACSTIQQQEAENKIDKCEPDVPEFSRSSEQLAESLEITERPGTTTNLFPTPAEMKNAERQLHYMLSVTAQVM